MTLQQGQSDLPQQGEVDPTVPLLDSAVVLPEAHVQRPVLAVLDLPMPPDGVAVLLRAHVTAADEVTHLFARLLARLRPFHVIRAHHLQARPILLPSYPFRVGDDRHPALLDAAVAFLLLVLIRLALDLRIVHGGAHARDDVLAQVLLVVLRREDVVAASQDAPGRARLMTANALASLRRDYAIEKSEH